MDRYLQQHDSLFQNIPPHQATVPALLAYAIAGLLFLHQSLVYFDVAILSPLEILWNALVYLAPAKLLLDGEKRKQLSGSHTSWSQTHAAKSEAMRSMLGLGGRTLMQQLPAGGNLARRMSVAGRKVESDAPPGLGNWDNSCYQNSVLQALSAIDSLRTYLAAFSSDAALPSNSTSSALVETVAKLHDATNNGRHIWTPAKLKSMSSWQQQDAQEYYSKIVDDLEQEAKKVFGTTQSKPGLEHTGKDCNSREGEELEEAFRNPLEGLLAQRVACTRCGFSEGLSMIPFNCLTVPLGSSYEYDIASCLDEYTNLEDISEVECAKCTLLRAQSEIKRMLPQQTEESGAEPAPEVKKVLQLPPELRQKILDRLEAVEKALEADDFSDKTLNESCQISKKARVSSTKSRQAVVGRAPQSLVIHVNRSVFDEMTGDQRKNYAAVRYPEVLDLGKWMLGSQRQDDSRATPSDPIAAASRSMLSNHVAKDQCLYRLKSVVTHYGRHENGHYTAYRQHPPASLANKALPESDIATQEVQKSDGDDGKLPWWRLSDEDVSSVSGEEVLRQGGVFMLFYERDPMLSSPSASSTTPITLSDPTPAVVETSHTPPEATTVSVDETTSATTPASPPTSDPSAQAQAPSLPSASIADPSEPSTGTTTEDESEADIDDTKEQPAQQTVKPVAHPRMRTARLSSIPGESGFGSPGRAVAAT